VRLPHQAEEFKRLLTGQYPAFVRERSPAVRAGELPVFVGHSIHAARFEARLRFLRDNGYQTATASEYVSWLAGDAELPDRTVVLTIDDARSSVWTVAAPLLERYGMLATLFMIPGYTPDGPVRPQQGDASAESAGDGDPEPMRWAELRAMQERGLAELQSHTRYHRKVPISTRVVDFLHPGYRRATYDTPLPPGYEERLASEGQESLWGMPIFESDSLLSGRPLFLPDETVLEDCMRFVGREGGSAFFARRSWREELGAVLLRSAGGERTPGRFVEGERLRERIVDDLVASRRQIEVKLPEARVSLLCYPYGIGSPLAVECARAAGFSGTFALARTGRSANRRGDQPIDLVRVKDDYILRLPGNDRAPLHRIMFEKVDRRLRTGRSH
jgi:hypothetical protein